MSPLDSVDEKALPVSSTGPVEAETPKEIFKKLSLLDKLLSPLIIIAMIVGVVIGEFVPGVQAAFDTVRFNSVSVRE
ncbi:hypothetical protein H0H93_016995 [Arthromyces matolae]|nr:hypothetical protein H0H93_016995 [Arthromyces matolae]